MVNILSRCLLVIRQVLARLCYHLQQLLYIIVVSVAMISFFFMVDCFQMSMSVARSPVFVALTLCVGILKEDISVCAGWVTSEKTTLVLVKTSRCLL